MEMPRSDAIGALEEDLEVRNKKHGDGDGDVEVIAPSQNASSALRRLPSPISSASGLDATGGAGGAISTEALKAESAAKRIQVSWRRYLLEARTAKTLTAASPAYARIQQFLDKLDAGQMPFEQTRLALQNPNIQRAMVAALAALPPDEILSAMPQSSRSSRAVLSSTMIVYHASEVLPTQQREVEGGVTDGRGQIIVDPAAETLRNASGLMLASIKAVTASLEPVAKGEKGSRKVLMARLGALRLSRRYLAVSLVRWKGEDAQRVAAQVVQPYARVYAMKLTAAAENDRNVADAAQKQLDQYRQALEKLVGHERANLSLQEVEQVVDADVGGGGSSADHSHTSAIEEREGDDTSDRRARQGSPTERAGFVLGGERQGTGGRATAAASAASGATDMEGTEVTAEERRGRGYELPDGQLGRLLANERLAHEILVNPEFQIPAADGEGPDTTGSAVSPEEELTRRLGDTMRRIFWDRFAQSLLPPPPSRPRSTGKSTSIDDADQGQEEHDAPREGSRVHARFGSDRGSYYTATVLSVTRNVQRRGRSGDGSPTSQGGRGSGGAGTDAEGVFVDVRFDEDGIVERGVPISRIKTGDYAPDFDPLLSLLEEVRAELISLTPNNRVLVGEVQAELAHDRLRGILEGTTLDPGRVQELIGFITGRILDLQAPARAETSKAWLRGFDAELEAAVGSGDMFAIVPLLPRAFEFVFARVEEIKRDVANAHIRLIAPYLARHGADYEREKFQARLAGGAETFDLTKAWIFQAVERFLASAEDEGERSRRAAGLRDGREELHIAVLQEAFIGLLRSDIRLDRPEAKLPETLAADGTRLAAARDDVDRVTLVATLGVLLRQVLARLRINCPAPTMTTLQGRLSALLKQDGVTLPQIVEECIAAASRLASAARNTGSPEDSGALPPGEKEGLRSLLTSSADPSNQVFRLYFGRVLLALKAWLCSKQDSNGQTFENDAAEAFGRHGLQAFAEELRPVGDRLRRLFYHNLKVFSGNYGPFVTYAAREFHRA